MPGQVFISYSREDEKWLDRLDPFLKPLEKQGLVTAWSDRRIKGGEEFDDVIEKALQKATAVVLLISAPFFASDYITDKELPLILKRYKNEGMAVLPVFLSISGIKNTAFPELAKINGYGSPDKPLESKSDTEWKQEFEKLAARILELAKEVAPPPTPPPSPSVDHAELWCRMVKQGEQLQISFSLSREEKNILPVNRRWDEVAGLVGKMNKMVQKGTPDLLEDNYWGGELYKILFGLAQPQQQGLFNQLFAPLNGKNPTPIFAPVKLHIITQMDELLTLPWRLTRWNGHLLAENGWQFLPSDSDQPPTAVTLLAPAPVLVISAEGESLHVKSLREVMERVWGSPKTADPWFKVAATLQEVQNGLRGMEPQLIYIHGEANQEGIVLPDGLLPFNTLASLVNKSASPTKLVCFNTSGPFPLQNQLFSKVPLLVQRAITNKSHLSDSHMLHWFALWLGQGHDPMTALHSKSTLEAETATLIVVQRFSTWQTTFLKAPRKRHPFILITDRDEQKGMMRKWLGELANHSNFRLMAVVPRAEEGNHLPHFSEQIQHDLEQHMGEVVVFKRVSLSFPEPFHNSDDFAAIMRAEGKFAANTPLGQVIRGLSPKKFDNRRPVLWLDWGCHGRGEGCSPPLTESLLNHWLNFCALVLAEACPPDLRVMTTLAIQTSQKQLKVLEDALSKAHRKLNTPFFWLRFLEPLKGVPPHELDDILRSSDYECPFAIFPELSQRMMDKTNGRYEELVALLQEGLDSGWLGLLDRLRKEQGASPPEEDITF